MQQVHLPKIGIINKILIVVFAIFFIIDFLIQKIGGFSFRNQFSLSPSLFLSGQFYQLLTYPFFPSGIFEAVFDGLLLWFLGSELEQMWGRRKYLFYLFFSLTVGGILYVLISVIFFQGSAGYFHGLNGMSGMAACLCVTYAILFPTRLFTFMFVIPLQAKYFAWILVGISLFQGLATPGAAGAWGHLGTILAGFVALSIMSHPKTKGLFSPKSISKKSKGRANLTLVKEDDDNEGPPKYYH